MKSGTDVLCTAVSFSRSRIRSPPLSAPTLCVCRPNLLWPVALRLKASDALALRSDRLDPIRERQHELLQEFAVAIADELAVLIEELVGMADIGFGLLHGRHVQKHERLPQMMIAPKAPIALGEQLTIAPGLRSQTLLPYGLEPTSSAFLRTAGIERLYSGVTNSTASAALTRWRNAVQCTAKSRSLDPD